MEETKVTEEELEEPKGGVEKGETEKTKREVEKASEGETEKPKPKVEKEQMEAPKVKQVTFQQEEDHIAEGPHKKPRKRMKGILKQLKTQVRCSFKITLLVM